MARRTLSDLASAGVRALWERRAFTQRELAAKVGIPTSSIHRVLQGAQPVTLPILEAVGALTHENPLRLLADPNDEFAIVTPVERQLLRYFRKWPLPTRDALIAFASFFGDDDPVTYDEKVAREQLRRLPDGKRRLAYGYLTFLTEGDLAPDIRRALGLPETDAPQSTRTTKRQPKNTPSKPPSNGGRE